MRMRSRGCVVVVWAVATVAAKAAAVFVVGADRLDALGVDWTVLFLLLLIELDFLALVEVVVLVVVVLVDGADLLGD